MKKEEEKMPTMDEEEVALIKLDLDNKTIKTGASLFNFRERLGALVGHRGERGGGPHHWCLVCGAIASTHQKKPCGWRLCPNCRSKFKTRASLEHNKCKKSEFDLCLTSHSCTFCDF